MKIGNNSETGKIPEFTKETNQQKKTAEQPSNAAVQDQVTISTEGREKLRELAETTKAENAGSTNKISLKLMKIRNRVESGYYDTDKVIDRITEKLSILMKDQLTDIKTE